MKGVVIYSGANQRAVITFLRFCRENEINFFIIANGKEDEIFLTPYSDNVVFTRGYNKLSIEDLIQVCKNLKSTHNIEELLVLPSSEYLNRFLLKWKDELILDSVSTGLCDKHLYEQISDKRSFTDLCSKYGISVPNEYAKIPAQFPFVCKPKTYSSDNSASLKPVLIESEKDLDLIPTEKLDKYFFQEFVGGESYYFFFHFTASGDYSVFSQQNMIQQDCGGSMIFCKASSIHINNPVVKQYAELFKSVNFHGLVMVEVKYFNDKYFMIEANPRIWGPLQLVLDSGMSLLKDFAIDNGLLKADPVKEINYVPDTLYFWSGGICQNTTERLKLHTFDGDLFLSHYKELMKSEIYLRHDTIQIYLKENHG